MSKEWVGVGEVRGGVVLGMKRVVKSTETDIFGPSVHIKDLKYYLENSRKSLKDF